MDVKQMAKVLACVFCVLFAAVPACAAADADARKQELERLKRQAAQKQEELKKYREKEQAISREISALENRKAEAQRQKNKLESDIQAVEKNILSTEDKRAALERSMPMWRSVVREETANYYLAPRCAVCPGDWSPLEELFLERALTHKAEFAVALQEENQAAKQKIYDFEKRNKKLLEQSSQIAKRQQVISTNFLKKQQDLNLTKKKTAQIREELNELNKSARALDDLLAKFERQRKAEAAKRQAKAEAEAKKTGASVKKQSSIAKIDLPAHSLPWPVQGKIISKFGKEYRRDLNTWIFRDGIKISARAGESVKSVASGEVIYAGPFRSYGNVVIVDHGKGFFSIYGFLSQITASVGEKLPQGGVIGTAGLDTQQSSGTGRYAVYFETRQGAAAVDPEQWLRPA